MYTDGIEWYARTAYWNHCPSFTYSPVNLHHILSDHKNSKQTRSGHLIASKTEQPCRKKKSKVYCNDTTLETPQTSSDLYPCLNGARIKLVRLSREHEVMGKVKCEKHQWIAICTKNGQQTCNAFNFETASKGETALQFPQRNWRNLASLARIWQWRTLPQKKILRSHQNDPIESKDNVTRFPKKKWIFFKTCVLIFCFVSNSFLCGSQSHFIPSPCKIVLSFDNLASKN